MMNDLNPAREALAAIPTTAPLHPSTGMPAMPAHVKPWLLPKGETSEPAAPSSPAPTAPVVFSTPAPVPYKRHVVDAHEIPAALRELDCWVAWRLKPNGNGKKPGKEPISPISGVMTGWTDPANQGTFEQARDYAEAHKMHGLGIVLTPGCGIAGGDLDHCVDPVSGAFSDTAKAIIAEAATYSELSPGLTGIRFLAKGSFGGFAGTDHAAGIEFYEAGHFLTITGNHIEETPFAIADRDLTELGRRFFPTKGATTHVQPGAGAFYPVEIASLEIPDFTRHVIETGDVDRYQGDRSAALFGVAKDLLRAGLSAEDTARVLTDPANGISAKALEERHGDLASALDWTVKYTVTKAMEEVRSAPPAVSMGFLAKPGQDEAAALLDSPRLIEIDLSNFASATVAPPQFLIEPIVPRGHVSLLGGHGGAGKSVLGLTLAAHVAVARPWGPLEVSGGRALYVSLEDPGDLVLFRLKRIVEAYDLPIADVVANLRIFDGTEAGPIGEEISAQGVRSLRMTTIAAQVAVLAREHDLIVIDNASDAFDADENNRRQVRSFIKGLAGWVRAHNAAVLLLVHIDKAAAKYGANGNTYSGNTAWHNSARSRLALTERDGTIELAHEKLNVGKKREEPIRLSWGDTGVLVPYDPTGADIALRIVDHADDTGVLAAVKAALAAGDVVSVAKTGPATAWHTLRVYAELPTTLKQKPGKARLDACLVRLQRAGVICREQYRNASRHVREKWVLADSCANVRQCCADAD